MPHKKYTDIGISRDYQIVCSKCGKKTFLDEDDPRCHNCGKMICPECLSIDTYEEVTSNSNGCSGSVECASCGWTLTEFDC
jgi:hypothetical protein